MSYTLSYHSPDLSFSLSGDDPVALTLKAKMMAGVSLGEAQAPALAAVEQPKKGAKKPKDTTPVQTDIEDVTKTASEIAAEAPALTSDDIINKLKDVNAKFGMQAVRELINPFGAQKIGEVKPADYAAVIAAADKKLAA